VSGESSEARELPNLKLLLPRRGEIRALPPSKSALKQRVNKDMKPVTENSPRRVLLRSRLTSTAPSGRFVTMIKTLPRRYSSLLFQLHTCHVPLNKYLQIMMNQSLLVSLSSIRQPPRRRSRAPPMQRQIFAEWTQKNEGSPYIHRKYEKTGHGVTRREAQRKRRSRRGRRAGEEAPRLPSISGA